MNQDSVQLQIIETQNKDDLKKDQSEFLFLSFWSEFLKTAPGGGLEIAYDRTGMATLIHKFSRDLDSSKPAAPPPLKSHLTDPKQAVGLNHMCQF